MARSAAGKSNGDSQGQLQLEQARAIVETQRPHPTPPPNVAAAPLPSTLMQTRYADERQRRSFGGWLVSQTQRDGAVGALIAAAAVDRTFPKHGSPDDVRKHVGAKGADPDMFEAIDDTESAWLRD